MRNKIITILFCLVVVLAVVWKLYLVYGGLRNFGYIVPPGEDPMYHAYMVKDILAGHSETVYPLLFHRTIALISRVSNYSPITVINYLMPAMVLLPAIGCYVFLRLSVSRKAALIGFLLMLLTSNYGLVAYGDGNYPNILTMGLFAPIALAFLLKLLRDRSPRNILGATIFFVLMVLTHHLTTALVLAVSFFFGIVLLVYSIFLKPSPHIRKISLTVLSVPIIALVLVAFLPQKALFQDVVSNLRNQSTLIGTKDYAQIISITDTADLTGQMIFYIGLFCLVYLVMMLGQNKKNASKLVATLILTWFVVIFVLSRIEIVGLPARIAREVGIPLVLAVAITIDDILNKASSFRHKILLAIMICLIFSGSLVQYNNGFYCRPEYFTRMVWFWPEDKEKVEYILSSLEGKTVLSNEATPYLKIMGEGKIVISDGVTTEEDIKQQIDSYNLSYVMAMKPHNPIAYPERAERDERVRELINNYAQHNQLSLIKEFEDGTKIYKTQSNF